jgi:hypothetical protein
LPWIDKASERDAVTLSRRLREADRRELEACGVDYLEALLQGVRDGPSWTIIGDLGRVVALFGCSASGAPWLLATDDLETHWRWFLRNSQEIVRLMQGDHPIITNAVDTRNDRHVRWLRWAGFDLGPIRTTPSGVPFQLFARRHPCASLVPARS